MADAEVIAMKKFWKREEGSVALLVAVAFVVLIGCGALVVDLGSIANEKRSLQNAMDAAALAAAQALPDEADATTAAQHYAASNGAGTVNVSFSVDGKTVTVSSSQDVEYNFAKALVGSSHTTVRARAVATQSNIFGSLDYALFSGAGDINLTFTGQNNISGNIHSNDSIVCNGQTSVTNGSVTAVGSVDTGGLTVETGYETIDHSTAIPMPDYTAALKANATVVTPSIASLYGIQVSGNNYSMTPTQYSQLLTYSANRVIFIDGNVTVSGSGNISTAGCLVASGQITFDGSKAVLASLDDTVALCSEYSGDGAVTFNGGGLQLYGMIYAPFGEVRLDGKSGTLNGSIVANSITDKGGLTINYDSTAGGSIPVTRVRLVD